jgi:putative pyruvate formate lyase activating enzyme
LIFSGRGEKMSDDRSSPKIYPSYLNLVKSRERFDRLEKLKSYYQNCSLCPRDCRVDRTRKELGKCRASDVLRVSSAFPHFGEERPLVGQKGSGTLFFSLCGLRCSYCQNSTISFEGEGADVEVERAAQSMLKLQRMGCHNINLVTPTHFLPGIFEAVFLAADMGLNIPIVYNTSGYEKVEILQLLDGIVDIYLPDFKYMNPEFSAKFSSEAYNYPHFAREAFKEMFRQVGDLEIHGRGIAKRGLMVRHLVLPNRIAGTKDILRFVSENLSRETYINIMRQYRPEYKARQYTEINTCITLEEYNQALKWARDFGLTRLDC